MKKNSSSFGIQKNEFKILDSSSLQETFSEEFSSKCVDVHVLDEEICILTEDAFLILHTTGDIQYIESLGDHSFERIQPLCSGTMLFFEPKLMSGEQ